MITDNIKICAEKTERQQLIRLIEASAEKLGVDACKKTLLLTQPRSECENTDGCEQAVVPIGVEARGFAEVFTYSCSDFSADLALLNPQYGKEDNISFELICGSCMGRIFIAKDSDISIETALACAALLKALGCELIKIIEALNSILKKQ